MSDQRRRFHDRRYIHFVTFSVSRRRRLLDLDDPKRIVLGVLNHQLVSMGGKCVGFVIMPDHVHALLWLPEPQQIERFLYGWKRMSSYGIRQWYAAHAPRYFEEFGTGGRFWQPKSYIFHVYTEAKLDEKLNYIHENPVRAGLVERAVDWKWSSARWYIAGRTVLVGQAVLPDGTGHGPRKRLGRMLRRMAPEQPGWKCNGHSVSSGELCGGSCILPVVHKRLLATRERPIGAL